jgi:hypothetical protein
VCPLALKDNLGGLHHSLVTNCLKGRHTFFFFLYLMKLHHSVHLVLKYFVEEIIICYTLLLDFILSNP